MTVACPNCNGSGRVHVPSTEASTSRKHVFAGRYGALSYTKMTKTPASKGYSKECYACYGSGSVNDVRDICSSCGKAPSWSGGHCQSCDSELKNM